MNSLLTYMLESEEKTYDFKIKIACDEIDTNKMDRIEHALSAFKVSSISKPKRLPISNSLDFPKLGACEVTLLNTSLKYPCTDAQLLHALIHQARLPAEMIVVIPKNSPEELMRDETANAKDEDKKDPILTKDLENISGGQIQVGIARVESLLKELEAERKTKNKEQSA